MLLLQHAVLYVVGESLPKTDFLTQIDKCIVLTTLTLASTGYNSRIIAWMHERPKISLMCLRTTARVD